MAGDDEASSPASDATATAGTTSDGSEVTPPAEKSGHTPTIDELRGTRWIVVSQDDETWARAYVPYLEFGEPGSNEFIGGNDGCNWYGGAGSLANDRLEFGEVGSTGIDCGPGTGGVAPRDGDRVVIDRGRLELHDDNSGTPRLVLARLDGLAAASSLSGSWRLDADSPSLVEFGDDERMRLGKCEGISYRLTRQLRMLEVPADPYTSCAQDVHDQTFNRLVEMLVSGPVRSLRGADNNTVYLADEQFVIRLTRTGVPQRRVTEAPTVDMGPVTDSSTDERLPAITIPPAAVSQPETLPPGSSNPTTPQTVPSASLEEALRGLGVDVESAPPEAMHLDGALFCGVDGWDGDEYESETAAQRCLIERYEAGERAIAVEELVTPEGDPVITIFRADPAGVVDVYTDRTRDAFGSGNWEVAACDGVTHSERSDYLRLRGCKGGL